MAPIFYFPLLGTPTAPFNQLWFYEAGTDVPLNVFSDNELVTPWAQPIVLNSAGESDGPIYVSPSPSYKVVYKDANNVPIPGYPVDFVAPSTIINVMTVSTTVLTNAQIKALPTTPITLIAAPASGLRVRMFAISFHANTAAGAYTNINASYADLHTTPSPFDVYGVINDSTTTPALTAVTDLLGSAGNFLYDVSIPSLSNPTSGGLEYVQNVNVRTVASANGVAVALVSDNNGSGNFTGGNVANSMTVTIYYALESVL